FYNWKLGTKLFLSFVIVAAVMGFVGYEGLSTIHWLKGQQGKLYEGQLLPNLALANARKAFQKIRIMDIKSAMPISKEERMQIPKISQELEKEFFAALEQYRRHGLSDEEKADYGKVQEAWKAYGDVHDKVTKLVAQGKGASAVRVINSEGNLSGSAVEEALGSIIQKNIKSAELTNSEINQKSAAANATLSLMLFCGVGLAIGIGFFITRTINKPIKDVINNINRADLNSQFNTKRKDELGELQRSFDSFVASMKETLLQVAEATSAVASASSEISTSTEEMAAGAQEQTSQTSEIATAVEQMTKTIVENSRNVTQISDGAKLTRKQAEEGGVIVEETVVGMNRIAEVVNRSAEKVQVLGKSSEQIGEIIGVIDDIADQTNLLALNAAIEAARAGEQGRGFAVVADEVRKLAERTTKATKEIAVMIKQIQTDTKEAVGSMLQGRKEVDEGIQLAGRAKDKLVEIVENVQNAADTMAQVATSTEEQSSTSEQIAKNVEAVSAVTQQTASGTQQIARAAEDLNRLTENLQQLVNKFKLSNDAAHQGVRSAQRTFSSQESNYAVRENGVLVEHA
ncbi:MAG: methyl-accepting chemotaxis protein, partial [Ignavibacteriales bacterium]|nr:methyl-accepting chemotaxis protein [Ignavibacteriales bacterium]